MDDVLNARFPNEPSVFQGGRPGDDPVSLIQVVEDELREADLSSSCLPASSIYHEARAVLACSDWCERFDGRSAGWASAIEAMQACVIQCRIPLLREEARSLIRSTREKMKAARKEGLSRG